MINYINLTNTVKTFFAVGVFYLYFDLLCFFLWVFSEQLPSSGFYFGALTASFLRLVL